MPRHARLLSLLLVIFTALLLGGCLSRPPLIEFPKTPRPALGADATTFETTDGIKLFGQWWNTPNPKAVILLIHGTALHSGFYAGYAEHMRSQGYAVGAVDLRSWGQSQGYGAKGYVGNYDEYLNDVRALAADAAKRYPGTKVYLQGESLGGTVVLLAHITRAVKADGLILNAPAVHASPGLFGWHAPHWMTTPLLFGGKVVGQTYPNLPLLPMWDSAANLVFFDEQAKERFVNDPYTTHDWLPAKYVDSLYNGMRKVRLNLRKVRAPMLIIQGTKDNLVPVDSSELLCKRSNSSDRTLYVYEGMSHATLHDESKESVWADTTQWLDRQTSAGPKLFNGCPDEPKVLHPPKLPKLSLPDWKIPFLGKKDEPATAENKN